MEKIDIFVKIRPLTYPSGVKVIRIKDPLPGPHCISCECGLNYAAFKMKPNTDFEAFQNSLQILARNYMKKNGLIKPLTGPISFEVVVGCQRPLYHFDSGGIIQDYQYRVPMKLPAFYRILESTSKALYGVAFNDMKQVATSKFSRVYRENDSLHITLREVNPSDVDSEIKQMELF